MADSNLIEIEDNTDNDNDAHSATTISDKDAIRVLQYARTNDADSLRQLFQQQRRHGVRKPAAALHSYLSEPTWGWKLCHKLGINPKDCSAAYRVLSDYGYKYESQLTTDTRSTEVNKHTIRTVAADSNVLHLTFHWSIFNTNLAYAFLTPLDDPLILQHEQMLYQRDSLGRLPYQSLIDKPLISERSREVMWLYQQFFDRYPDIRQRVEEVAGKPFQSVDGKPVNFDPSMSTVQRTKQASTPTAVSPSSRKRNRTERYGETNGHDTNGHEQKPAAVHERDTPRIVGESSLHEWHHDSQDTMTCFYKLQLTDDIDLNTVSIERQDETIQVTASSTTSSATTNDTNGDLADAATASAPSFHHTAPLPPVRLASRRITAHLMHGDRILLILVSRNRSESKAYKQRLAAEAEPASDDEDQPAPINHADMPWRCEHTCGCHDLSTGEVVVKRGYPSYNGKWAHQKKAKFHPKCKPKCAGYQWVHNTGTAAPPSRTSNKRSAEKPHHGALRPHHSPAIAKRMLGNNYVTWTCRHSCGCYHKSKQRNEPMPSPEAEPMKFDDMKGQVNHERDELHHPNCKHLGLRCISLFDQAHVAEDNTFVRDVQDALVHMNASLREQGLM